jgi:hypothetical protein
MCCSYPPNSLIQWERGSTQQHCTMFNYRQRLAYIKELQGGWAPPSEHSQLPQTKPGGSIPLNMAQYVRIKCLEMWDLCPSLFLTCSPLFLHSWFPQTNAIVPHNMNLSNLLFLWLKINHITNCNDCAFILVLGVDTNSEKA